MLSALLGTRCVGWRRIFAKGSALLSKSSGATVALAAVACSGDAGRSRAEDTTAQANNPSGGSSYGTPGGAAGGTAAAPGGGEPGEGPDLSMSTYLSVSEGWVAGDSNGYGIQGAFFTYQDGTGRTTIMNDAAESPSGYCVSGTSAEVLDENFSGTWGAVAALNLSQEVGSTTAASYDAALRGVVGIGFDIVGDTGGALRFVVKQFSVHDGCSASHRSRRADGVRFALVA